MNLIDIIYELSNNLITGLELYCDNNLKQSDINIFSLALNRNTSLQFLTINYIYNENLDYSPFFEALYSHNLKYLKINGSTNKIINFLINLLHINKSIETLILYNVIIPDIKLFITILENNILKSLILRRNNIKHITPIAEALKTNSSLIELCLGSNKLTYINPLIEALKINKTLKILWLDSNQISMIDDFIQLLKLDGPLQFINIYCNPIRNSHLLLRLLKDNNTLKYFNYLYNSVSNDGIMLLNEIYKENKVIKV